MDAQRAVDRAARRASDGHGEPAANLARRAGVYFYPRPVAEDIRPPVAIRVVRPYKTEAELLAAEGETITKTSVVLLGALHRPQGVILRFELTLSNGDALIRGEGRVTAYRERAHGDQSGLALRFTRLDPKSKAFVDRAVALREGAPEPPAAAPVAEVPEVSTGTFSAATVRPPTPMDAPTVPPPPEVGESRVAEEQPTRPAGGSVLPPAETRGPALERLRARARTLGARGPEIVSAGKDERARLKRLAARRSG